MIKKHFQQYQTPKSNKQARTASLKEIDELKEMMNKAQAKHKI